MDKIAHVLSSVMLITMILINGFCCNILCIQLLLKCAL